MRIEKRELPILAVNIAYIAVFGGLSLARLNYEFIIYCAVVIAVLVLILAYQDRVRFTRPVLWGLTLWGFLHMAGGHVAVGDGRLYDVLLLPLVRRGEVEVLRYDQAVHAWGFGVATLVCFHLLRPNLGAEPANRAVLAFLTMLMGMGLGALNEVIELLVVLIVPQSGVGGYFNTAFDLLFNMIGAAVAAGLVGFGVFYSGSPRAR